MKRIVLSAALAGVALAVAVPAAQAQTATILKPFRLGIAAGVSVPTADFAEGVSTGYNVTAMLAYTRAGMPLSFRLEGGYNQFSVKDASNNAKEMNISANIVFPLRVAQLSPYFIAGGGWYRESVTGFGSEVEGHLGYNAGLGVNLPLAAFTTFIEARYHRIPEKGFPTTFIPITFGILF